MNHASENLFDEDAPDGASAAMTGRNGAHVLYVHERVRPVPCPTLIRARLAVIRAEAAARAAAREAGKFDKLPRSAREVGAFMLPAVPWSSTPSGEPE